MSTDRCLVDEFAAVSLPLGGSLCVDRRFNGQLTARLASAVVVAVLTGALTACKPPLNGGLSISVNTENELLVGFCSEPMPVTDVRVYIRSEKETSDEELVGRGLIHLETDQVLAVRPSEEGLDFGSFPPLSLHPRGRVEVHMYEARGKEAGTAWGVFTIPDGGLRPGRWLFADGSGSNRICGAYER